MDGQEYAWSAEGEAREWEIRKAEAKKDDETNLSMRKGN